MLYFLYPLAKYHIFFNLFRYITLRTAGAAITAMIISFALGPYLIKRLKALDIGQTIREDGPHTHYAKAGTPTMGGILILISVLIPTLLWSNLTNRYVWIVLLVTTGLGLMGFLDDYLKLIRKRSLGLRAREKFGFQIALGFLVGLYLYLYPADSMTTKIAIPFSKEWTPDLGVLYIAFVILVIVGSSNAVNLTDGLDGLAIGPIIIASGAFAILAYLTGHANVAWYLRIFNVKGAGELTIFCGAIAGASLGFLWFNSYPAQVFMGDVGALALGGSIGAVAILTKHELLLLFIGGLFVVETLSVIFQVVSYKLTGKRIFKMAPLHHHFELKGWSEPKIIVRFWIMAFILALLALTTLKVR